MNIDWMVLFITIFIVYRLTFVIIYDEGPFAIFHRIRSLVKGPEWLLEGLGCPVCVSFWLSLGAGLLIASSLLEGILIGLAIAGFIVFLFMQTGTPE